MRVTVVHEGHDGALHTGRPAVPTMDFLPFGFGLTGPEPVRAMLARLAADGVPIIEVEDEPDLVSFKCLDPDGYRVEVYWEPR